VRRLIHSGKLVGVKFDGKWRIDVADLKALIERTKARR